MCHVMFSWLGVLVPVFQLMELDLLSLEGLAVSRSSKFCGVYGFSVSLGRASGFGDVRHVYIRSHFKVALSAYFHFSQPPTYSWNHCWCLCSPFPPCTVGQSLLGRGLCGFFLAPQLCSLCCGDVWASLSTLSCPLHNGSCVHLSQLTEPPSRRACVFFWLPRPILCATRVVCTGQVCMTRHSQHCALLCFAGLLWASLGSEPTIVVSCSWAEKFSFLCFLASKSLLGPVFQDYEAPPWVHM